jgi:hypothetical protein
MRKEHAEDHFAYLAAYRDRILLAGGLRNNPAEWFCGGMLVMGVGSRAEAAALCENGPLCVPKTSARCGGGRIA